MKIKTLLLWTAVAVWMLVIFMFSAQPASVSGDTSGGFIEAVVSFIYPGFSDITTETQSDVISSLQHIVRKGAHFTVFFILGSLLFAALSQYSLEISERLSLSLLVSLLYAASDELHQYFIPGRAARITDILIDFAGSSFAIILLSVFAVFRAKSKRV